MATTLTMADALRDIAAAIKAQPRTADGIAGVTAKEYAAHRGLSILKARDELRTLQSQGRLASVWVLRQGLGRMASVPIYTLTKPAK